MQTYFDAHNASEGPVRFFLSWDAEPAEEQVKVQTKFLSLGSSYSEWHLATTDLSRDLYEQILDSAPERMALTGVSTRRQYEILFGHVASLVARRLSRSITQLEQVDSSWLLDKRSFSGETSVQISLPRTSEESHRLVVGPEFGKLVEHLAICKKFGISKDISIAFLSSPSRSSSSENKKMRISFAAYLLLAKTLSHWSRRNKVLLLGTYLGRLREIYLNFCLRQLPNFLEIESKSLAYESVARESTTLSTNMHIYDLAIELLRLAAPTNLVESLTDTLEFTRLSAYPTSPRVVFTSSAFTFNDNFKAYLAEKIDSVKYVVGQHGNNYGVSKAHDICIERATADTFLSWGWQDDDDRVRAIGQLKPNVKARIKRPISHAVLFLRSRPYFAQADGAIINADYWRAIKELCLNLNRNGVMTTLQFHASTEPEEVAQVIRSLKDLPLVRLQMKNETLGKVVRKGGMVVFTYDSTGMLELSSAGIPFYAFIPDGLGLVKANFRDNYQFLIDGGLLSMSNPRLASDQIAEIVRDPKGWSDAHRTSVQNFSRGLVHRPKSGLCDLKDALNPSP